MMIMPELKLAFIHIYKTGGTSLTQLLAPYTDPAFRAEETRMEGPGFQGTWHYQNAQHSKFSSPHGGFPKSLMDDLANWRFLAVVRNPYTWSHSLYREFFAKDNGDVRGANFLFGQVRPHRGLPGFHHFVENFMPGYSNEIGLATQSSFVDGVPEDQLTLIRFESYEEDVRRILPTLGVPVDHLPHALDRGDKKRKAAEALMRNTDHIAFCNKVYAEDFRNFNYDMAPVEVA